jgi:hypothetical protein
VLFRSNDMQKQLSLMIRPLPLIPTLLLYGSIEELH